LTTVHNSTGNIYEDLGYVNAVEMHIKATLSAKISEAIKSRRLTQTQATIICGMPRIMVSGILRGQFRNINKTQLIDCFRRLALDQPINLFINESNTIFTWNKPMHQLPSQQVPIDLNGDEVARIDQPST